MRIKRLKNLFLVVVSLLTLIVCTLGLSGCSSEGFTLYFGIDKMPTNLDPQKASSYSELLTIRNCFSGLTKLDKGDNAVLDLAESYEITNNGQTYTFKLKECLWSNGDAVTANDFVFAFNRASSIKTNSPYATLFLNIKGAAERLKGGNNELDVYASDETTLIINLVEPDQNFLLSLTNAVFMPCNQKFFENSSGKYGLDRKHIITNGKYTISSWDTDSFIRLSLPKDSKPENPLCAEKVVLTVSSSGKNNAKRIIDDEISLTGNIIDDFTAISTEKYEIETKYNTTYALIFNKNSEIGKNVNLSESFTKSIHRELYSSKLNPRFILADSVIPKDSFLLNQKISSLTELPKYTFQYSPDEARTTFLESIKSLKGGKLPKFSVVTIDSDETTAILTEVISKWQNNLGAYLNIETVANEEALYNKLKNGSYTAAFIPLSQNVPELLTLFSSTSNSGISINNSEYDKIIDKLNKTEDVETAKQLVVSAAEILSKESTVIPIYSAPKANIWNKDYQNVSFSEKFGTVDFSEICK